MSVNMIHKMWYSPTSIPNIIHPFGEGNTLLAYDFIYAIFKIAVKKKIKDFV